MKKIILITIRYSVLFGKNTKGFHLSATQKTHQDYRTELFSPERMSFREWMFDNITFPSLKSIYKNKPHDVVYKVVILTSSELPVENKKFLEQKAEKYSEWFFVSYIDPEYVKYGDHILKYIKEYKDGCICSTVRLDDDDALCGNYASLLSKFMNEKYDRSIVSFSLGYSLYLTKDKELIGAAELYQKNIAAGLAYVRTYQNPDELADDNVYTCGNHIFVSKNYTTIDFVDTHSFIRVNTETSDRMYRMDKEARRNRVKIEYKKQENKVKLEKVFKEFFALDYDSFNK